MFGALLLFENDFIHIVSIAFTALILTELFMVALTVRTWHYLMIVGELLSLLLYVASLFIFHSYFGECRIDAIVAAASCHWILTLCHSLLPYRCSYKASCARPGFVIFDIRALWRSVLSVRVPGCQKLQVTA